MWCERGLGVPFFFCGGSCTALTIPLPAGDEFIPSHGLSGKSLFFVPRMTHEITIYTDGSAL